MLDPVCPHDLEKDIVIHNSDNVSVTDNTSYNSTSHLEAYNVRGLEVIRSRISSIPPELQESIKTSIKNGMDLDDIKKVHGDRLQEFGISMDEIRKYVDRGLKAADILLRLFDKL
jgi:hypothetical protein